VVAVELATERAQLLKRDGVLGLCPRPAQPALDEVMVALGKVEGNP
jgi:hypothetical protein